MNLSSDMQTAFSEHIREKEVKLDTDLTVQVPTTGFGLRHVTPYLTPRIPRYRCSPPASGRRTSRTTSTCRRSSSRASRPSAPSTTVTIGTRLGPTAGTARARPPPPPPPHPAPPSLGRPHLPPPAALGALARQRDGARPVHAGRQDEEARPDGVDVPGVPPPRLQRPGRLHLLRHPAAPQPPRRGAQAVSRLDRRPRRVHRRRLHLRLHRRPAPASPGAHSPLPPPPARQVRDVALRRQVQDFDEGAGGEGGGAHRHVHVQRQLHRQGAADQGADDRREDHPGGEGLDARDGRRGPQARDRGAPNPTAQIHLGAPASRSSSHAPAASSPTPRRRRSCAS